MQRVSFHKVEDVDAHMFDHEEDNCLFSMWADGMFNPSDFDGVELIKIDDIKKLVDTYSDKNEFYYKLLEALGLVKVLNSQS